MVQLTSTTNELWPEQALIKIKEKSLSVNKLQRNFNQILFPWTLGYNDHRIFFKSQILEFPLFIIIVSSIQDVLRALNLAHNKNLKIRVNGGRHSSNIQNPDFYLDMSKVTHLHLNKHILQAGAGINQGKVYEYLDKEQHNHHYVHGTKLYRHAYELRRHLGHEESEVFPGGSAGSVGISGITTCGGIGSFKRTYGLAIDSVENFSIVVPPNKECDKSMLVKASENENPDLFWALRGGVGSNFGVVTEITYRLPTIENIIVYSVVWEWSDAKKVMKQWLDTAPSRSMYFNEDLSLHVFGSDKGISLGGLYVVPPHQTVKEAIKAVKKELLGLGGTLKYNVASYYATMNKLAEGRVYQPFSSTRTFMSNHKINVDWLVDEYEKLDNNGFFLFGIELLGGEIAKYSSNEAAYYPRQDRYFYDIVAYTDSILNLSTLEAFNSHIFSRLYVPKKDTVYTGFIIPELPDHLTAYYGDNKYRLVEIKNRVDPYGIMDFPQGI